MEKKVLEQMRQKAEQVLKNKGSLAINAIMDIEKLIEELNIYQIELEMQNNELMSTNLKLQNEQNKFHDLYFEAPIAYFTINETGNIIEINNAAAQLLEQPLHFFNHTSLFVYLEQSSKMVFNQFVKHVFEQQRVLDTELVFVNKDGVNIYTKVNAQSYFDEILGLKLCRFAVTDISENIRISKALIESEKRWKFALEGAGDGVWDWDLKNNQVYYSKQWKQMLGYQEYEIGNHLDEWKNRVHLDDLDKAIREVNRLISGETEMYMSVHRVMCKDKTYRWILDRGKIIEYGTDGTPIRIIGTHTDISDRKAIENELAKLNANKDRLLSIIAHDLKGPFNTLLGFSDLLFLNIEKYSAEKIKQFAAQIHDDAKSIYSLLENLLHWALAQADKVIFEPVFCNTQTLISNIIEELHQTIAIKNIILKNYVPVHTNVLVDQYMFTIIIRNLLSNAIKFSHRNGKIELKTSFENQFVQFSISDHGVGIKNEIIEKIFDIQHKTTTLGTEKEKGTGFGLKLCKEYVEKHGGRIWAESKVGEGSTFYFALPVN